MPTISMFYGIVIRMCREIGGKHNLPHIHAEYQNDEVVVSLNGDVLEGQIPNKKLKLVLAWLEIHNDELYANWQLLSNGERSFMIDPLR